MLQNAYLLAKIGADTAENDLSVMMNLSESEILEALERRLAALLIDHFVGAVELNLSNCI